MKKQINFLLVILFLASLIFAQPEFTADSIKNVCKRVAGGRLKSTQGNGWQGSTYYEGIMALYYMTKEKKYLDSAIAWGNYHNWLSSSDDTFPTNFDNTCCYQTYLEIYAQDTSKANYNRAIAALKYAKRYTYDTCPNNCKSPSWPIVDMYHMAGPIYPRAASLLKDSIMLDSLHKFAIGNNTRHYNIKDSLFNSNCGDTSRVRDAYWGRGCGWGVAAHCRILQWLPSNHPSKPWYEGYLKACLTRLVRLQNQTDGMWRSDLINHPEWNKEASATAFFTFGYFYAIRTGILDSAAFIGIAKKAWKGLLDCIGVDPAKPDLIGWSQGVGGGPSNNFGPTNHDEYTEGAFFLAGYEFYRLLTEGVTKGTTKISNENYINNININNAKNYCFIINNNRILNNIKVPFTAKNIKIYSLSGKLIYTSNNLNITQHNLFLKDKFKNNKGIVIVKFE
jgi:rhamnogalacturonyl hydrolase YesR